jgi:hypothetical protein
VKHPGHHPAYPYNGTKHGIDIPAVSGMTREGASQTIIWLLVGVIGPVTPQGIRTSNMMISDLIGHALDIMTREDLWSMIALAVTSEDKQYMNLVHDLIMRALPQSKLPTRDTPVGNRG